MAGNNDRKEYEKPSNYPSNQRGGYSYGNRGNAKEEWPYPPSSPYKNNGHQGFKSNPPPPSYYLNQEEKFHQPPSHMPPLPPPPPPPPVSTGYFEEKQQNYSRVDPHRYEQGYMQYASSTQQPRYNQSMQGHTYMQAPGPPKAGIGPQPPNQSYTNNRMIPDSINYYSQPGYPSSENRNQGFTQQINAPQPLDWRENYDQQGAFPPKHDIVSYPTHQSTHQSYSSQPEKINNINQYNSQGVAPPPALPPNLAPPPPPPPPTTAPPPSQPKSEASIRSGDPSSVKCVEVKREEYGSYYDRSYETYSLKRGKDKDPVKVYSNLSQIGEGTYGKVFRSINVKTGKFVALKCLRLENERDGFPITALREIKLLQKLKSERVVQLAEVFTVKNEINMVFEYLDYDLAGFLANANLKLSEYHIKQLMKQLLEGLEFMHGKQVVHRDIKGSNLLLNKKGQLKIADFGLARILDHRRNKDYTNRVFTTWYRPPELLLGATKYDTEVDMWGTGCILVEFFKRKPLFPAQDELSQLDCIYKIMGTPNKEVWPEIDQLPWYHLLRPKQRHKSVFRSTFSKILTSECMDLAETLLSMNPAHRISATQALQHPFFLGVDCDIIVDFPQPDGNWHEYEVKANRSQANKEVSIKHHSKEEAENGPITPVVPLPPVSAPVPKRAVPPKGADSHEQPIRATAETIDHSDHTGMPHGHPGFTSAPIHLLNYNSQPVVPLLHVPAPPPEPVSVPEPPKHSQYPPPPTESPRNPPAPAEPPHYPPVPTEPPNYPPAPVDTPQPPPLPINPPQFPPAPAPLSVDPPKLTTSTTEFWARKVLLESSWKVNSVETKPLVVNTNKRGVIELGDENDDDSTPLSPLSILALRESKMNRLNGAKGDVTDSTSQQDVQPANFQSEGLKDLAEESKPAVNTTSAQDAMDSLLDISDITQLDYNPLPRPSRLDDPYQGLGPGERPPSPRERRTFYSRVIDRRVSRSRSRSRSFSPPPYERGYRLRRRSPSPILRHHRGRSISYSPSPRERYLSPSPHHPRHVYRYRSRSRSYSRSRSPSPYRRPPPPHPRYGRPLLPSYYSRPHHHPRSRSRSPIYAPPRPLPRFGDEPQTYLVEGASNRYTYDHQRPNYPDVGACTYSKYRRGVTNVQPEPNSEIHRSERPERMERPERLERFERPPVHSPPPPLSRYPYRSPSPLRHRSPRYPSDYPPGPPPHHHRRHPYPPPPLLPSYRLRSPPPSPRDRYRRSRYM